MSDRGYFDTPEIDEFAAMNKMAEEPEHYRTGRLARDAHQIVEELSRPKKRETPPEVSQAHRIGFLEGKLEEATTRAHEEHRRAETLETQLSVTKDTLEEAQKTLTRVQNDSNHYSQEAARYKKLHTDLLNKRRYR